MDFIAESMRTFEKLVMTVEYSVAEYHAISFRYFLINQIKIVTIKLSSSSNVVTTLILDRDYLDRKDREPGWQSVRDNDQPEEGHESHGLFAWFPPLVPALFCLQCHIKSGHNAPASLLNYAR